jgi:hypothetical protein
MRVPVCFLVILALVVLACAPAWASLQSTDTDILVGGSWGWGWQENGYFGGHHYDIDQIVIQEVSGSHFEPLTFRQLGNGWCDIYDTGGIAMASGPQLTSGNLCFQMWFLGAYNPATVVHYYALCSGNLIGGGLAGGNFSFVPDQWPQWPPPGGNAIPEPASALVWCLLGLGSCFGMTAWRRKRAA